MKYHLTYHSCNYPPDIVNKHRTIRHSWTYCVTISWRVFRREDGRQEARSCIEISFLIFSMICRWDYFEVGSLYCNGIIFRY